MLGRLLGEVERPFVLVPAARRSRTSSACCENLGGRADTVLVGGKMAEELRDENPLPFAGRAADRRRRRERVRGGRRDAGRAVRRRCRKAGSGSTSAPRRGALRATRSATRRTVFWNGPMGVFEWEPFADGHEGGRARRSPRSTATRSSAAATRCARSTSSASPTGSPGSRPAAAPRSSCSRARSCPASAAIPEN